MFFWCTIRHFNKSCSSRQCLYISSAAHYSQKQVVLISVRDTGECFQKRQPKDRNPEIELILDQFYDYSIYIKCVRPNTVLRDISFIREFPEYFADDMKCRLDNISVTETEISVSEMPGRQLILGDLNDLSGTVSFRPCRQALYQRV